MNRLSARLFFVALVSAVILIALLLAACGGGDAETKPTSNPRQTTPALKGKITVSGAWALYPMMVKWADEFHKINPDVRIDVSAGGAGKGAADALGGLVDIGMVSREVFPAEIQKGAVYVPSVIDAVIATTNQNNPVKDDLLAKGIKKQTFIDIWITGKVTNWKQVFPDTKASGKTDIHVYTRSDSCGAAETWAKYLGDKKQEDLGGTGVYGDPGLAEAIRKDAAGIGYNNIGFVYDARTKKQLGGLLVVPIDVNENGKIDPEESFYGTMDELTRAIGNGAYPSPPARELNLVTLREFKGTTREFVKWILTDGQKFAAEAGYVPLSPQKVQQALEKLG